MKQSVPANVRRAVAKIKAIRQKEIALERQLTQLIAVALLPDVFAFGIPNEGKRDGAMWGWWLAKGCRAGMPDRAFIKDGLIYFLEAKREGGRVDPDQIACAQAIRLSGAHVGVYHNIAEAFALLREWGLIREKVSMI